MGRESMCTAMELATRETGRTINSTDREWKLGRMGRDMKESIEMARNMEKGSLSGLMEVSTRASFSITT